MLKGTLIATGLAAIAMGTSVSLSASPREVKPLDAEVIVEVDRDLETLTEEGISNTQKIVLNNIKSYLNSGVRVISKYSNIANAFAISVNSEDIELIKNIPGVKSVTVNELHWENYQPQSLATGGTGDSGEYGSSENISATTMKKPDVTNDGEGTVIAILDNEFYFRGSTEKGAVPAWNHETFTAFPTHTEGGKEVCDVAVRFKGSVISQFPQTHGGKNKGATPDLLGREGSCYFNNKIPYYYDYGGETFSHAEDYNEDFDVSSNISYHGSHVASIAAGNAESYKGIAPKAQLVCMKVFTNYKASQTDKLLGFFNSSGAYDIPILNALEDCLIIGVDGINMSLGSNLDDFDSESITSRVLNELAESGILSAISAGNDGKASYKNSGAYKNWTKDMIETGILSGNSNVPGPMGVASGQPEKMFYKTAFKAPDAADIIAYEDQIVNSDYSDTEYDVEYKIEDLCLKYGDKLPWTYVPGFGTQSDYDAVISKGGSFDGKLAVVNRGNTSFADKYNIAKANSCIGIVIINNDPTETGFNFHCSFGEGFKPDRPCCLVLNKDKGYFEQNAEGFFSIATKEVHDNPAQYTASTFSSDGATYDLDLKPEITTPGDNIRGAIPPQRIEDKTEERQYKVYEYLSGTSMAAPNYAGAQSVVLSEVTAPIYAKYKTSGRPSKAEQAEILDYRKTVDMRLMSTADPMIDFEANGEDGKKTITSPRKQGAGMVNLTDALATNVYLEGYDANGTPAVKKSKVSLRNNENINKGIIDFTFVAHNEAEYKIDYNMSLSVMRPAVVLNQEIATKEYDNRGEVDNIKNFPGFKYWVNESVTGGYTPVERTAFGSAQHNDVYKVTREIEYYASEPDLKNGTKTTIQKGLYYNAGTVEAVNWQLLPSMEYVSVSDVLVETVDLGKVTVNPNGATTLSVHHEISEATKAKIAELFKYGCYIEGYLTLDSVEADEPDLSMPYLGYYSIGHDEGKDYSEFPVVEPFSFEKDISQIYPSDLANDIVKSLVGRQDADMGSMMVAGYTDPDVGIDLTKVVSNDTNLTKLNGFYELGKDPSTGDYYANAGDNLYLGSANYTNTLIIQQFVLRSVKDNYFTITNKETGKVVYRSALEDALFGDRYGHYSLYKSHVDTTYLSAGYCSHRAQAVVPMYDVDTGIPYPSGEYEIKFNYYLVGTSQWTSKSYTLHIDSTAPEVRAVINNGNSLTFRMFDDNLSAVSVGRYTQEFVRNNDGSCTVTVNKDVIEEMLNEGFNTKLGSGRLFVGMTDKAYGKMGCLIRFDYDEDKEIYDFNKYTLVEHHSFTMGNDFKDLGDGKYELYEYDSKTRKNTPITVTGFVIFSNGMVPYIHDEVITIKGCGGNILTTSILVSSIALAGALTLIIAKAKNKKTEGGK